MFPFHACMLPWRLYSSCMFVWGSAFSQQSPRRKAVGTSSRLWYGSTPSFLQSWCSWKSSNVCRGQKSQIPCFRELTYRWAHQYLKSYTFDGSLSWSCTSGNSPAALHASADKLCHNVRDVLSLAAAHLQMRGIIAIVCLTTDRSNRWIHRSIAPRDYSPLVSIRIECLAC